MNRKSEKGKSIGVRLMIKKCLKEEELKDYSEEDVLAVRLSGAIRMVVVVIYQRCEQTDLAGNKKRGKKLAIALIAEEVRKRGEALVIGGDFSGHIWEIDG